MAKNRSLAVKAAKGKSQRGAFVADLNIKDMAYAYMRGAESVKVSHAHVGQRATVKSYTLVSQPIISTHW